MSSQYSREAVLEAQVQRLQEKLLENSGSQLKLNHLKGVQDREKEEWRESKRMLEERLTKTRRECEKLRRKELTHEARGIRDGSEDPPSSSMLHRSFSSQSLPAHMSGRDAGSRETYFPSRPSPPSSLHNYPLHSQLRPTLTPYSGHLGNSGLVDHGPLLGHPFISSSNSSINSIKSSNSALNHVYSDGYSYSLHKSPSDYRSLTRHSRVQGPFSSTPSYHTTTQHRESMDARKPAAATDGDRYTTSSLSGHTPSTRLLHRDPTSSAQQRTLTPSTSGSGAGQEKNSTLTPSRSEPSSPDVELQRSKLNVKRLEREASLLEQQLSDKTYSARGHVEELMLLRTQLAQEKASFAIVKQELRDQAVREVGVAKAAHSRQAKELEVKLKAVAAEKGRLEAGLGEATTKLKCVELECLEWRERVGVLEQEGGEERERHARDWGELHAEVDGGSAQVATLEEALRSARAEAQAHLSRLEAEARQHEADTWKIKRQVEVLSEEVRMKDASLTRHAEREAHLQQEAKEARAGLKQGHASWRKMRKELSEQLFQSEMAREALFKQLAETGRKLTFHSAQVEGKREAMMGELEKCRSEVHHLEGVVKAELAERKGVELEMERWKLEVEKAGRRCREAEGRQAEAEKRWGEERARKEASEREGESLRQEVGRLSEELRVCQRQLQAEKEGKVEKEKVMEESLAHLQQELAKRAQQVLEMDRLLQSHQAETTARRLQLERTLSQRQGELKQRTQELEALTSRAGEDKTTIAELRAQLVRTKKDQRSLFSGSQAQLLAKDSKVSTLETKLKESESALERVSREAEKLRSEVSSVEGRERECRVRCERLQSQVKSLTNENDSLHAKHLQEVESMQTLHISQLTSREEQAESHRQQLQQVARQEKARQEELSRCRTQVASLSAELSAERSVSEETRKQVLAARAKANQHQAQVARLQTTVSVLQEMLEKQAVDMVATPTYRMEGGLANGLPKVGVTSDLDSESNVEFVMLPNHFKTPPALDTPSSGSTPPPVTPPPGAATPPTPQPRGGIISI